MDSGPSGVNFPTVLQFILDVLCFRHSFTHSVGSPRSGPRDLSVTDLLGGGWGTGKGDREGEMPEKGELMGELLLWVTEAQSCWGPTERLFGEPLRTVPPRGRKLGYFSSHLLPGFRGLPLCAWSGVTLAAGQGGQARDTGDGLGEQGRSSWGSLGDGLGAKASAHLLTHSVSH